MKSPVSSKAATPNIALRFARARTVPPRFGLIETLVADVMNAHPHRTANGAW
jgi:hypothetical protein